MEKSTKSLLGVTGIVAAFALLTLALAGCGGAAPASSNDPSPQATCTYEFDLSPWTSCQPNGTQTRTIVNSTESTPNCAPTPALSQACTYVTGSCPAGNLFCSGANLPAAGICCPEADPLTYDGSKCYPIGTAPASNLNAVGGDFTQCQ